jgi:hypothetical protein
VHPRARFQKNRPTSRAGAAHAEKTLGLKCRAVLNVIIARSGASIAEIAHELGCGSNAVTSSIAHLRDDFKLIEDSGQRRATVTPCRGVVWAANKAGHDAANRRANMLHAPKVARVPAEVTAQPDLFSR